MSGFIQLPREIIEHEVFHRIPDYFLPFIKLSSKAVYGEDRLVGAQTLRAGDVWTSQVGLSIEWTWTRNRVKRFLKELEAVKLLTYTTDKRRNTGNTVISIQFLIGACIKRSSNDASNDASKRASKPASSRASKTPLLHREDCSIGETVEHQTEDKTGIKLSIKEFEAHSPNGAHTKKEEGRNQENYFLAETAPQDNLTANSSLSMDHDGHSTTEIKTVDQMFGGVISASEARRKTDRELFKSEPVQPAPVKKKLPNVWAEWISACKAAGRPEPLIVGKDTFAGKQLGEKVPDDAKRIRVMKRYLSDSSDFLVTKGHPLSMIWTGINAYLSKKQIKPKADWTDEDRMQEFLDNERAASLAKASANGAK